MTSPGAAMAILARRRITRMELVILTWESMCRICGALMPMLDAMRSYYDYTGDTNALNLMLNYCAWENTLPASDFGAGYWPTMRMGDNIESIYWLYNRVGAPWLFTFAGTFLKYGAVGQPEYPAQLAQREHRQMLPRPHCLLAAVGRPRASSVRRGQLPDRHERIWASAWRRFWRGRGFVVRVIAGRARHSRPVARGGIHAQL